ncbi:MAG TPA: hypothetical protein VG733_04145 [Chthoniobacteraceae bacterium]|nr:hypothetical protein [Verrucomicrobiae bacterium]HWB58654.1 hypothetical protein [Chthoniobacteraceae bacterium]
MNEPPGNLTTPPRRPARLALSMLGVTLGLMVLGYVCFMTADPRKGGVDLIGAGLLLIAGALVFAVTLAWWIIKTAVITMATHVPNKAEVVVVIAVVAILALLLPPAYSNLSERSRQASALHNAQSIAMAMRLYASDNNGQYPSYTLRDGKPTTTRVADSNTAFAQLFPTYVTYEGIFWVKNSGFCSANPPDEVRDDPPLETPVHTLAKGENEWAYVPGLTDSSNPAVPLIADGFANPATHTYATQPEQRGGVWKGRKAIVVRADSSGAIVSIDPATLQVLGPNGGPAPGDIFTTANSANGWLQPENKVVNPK